MRSKQPCCQLFQRSLHQETPTFLHYCPTHIKRLHTSKDLIFAETFFRFFFLWNFMGFYFRRSGRFGHFAGTYFRLFLQKSAKTAKINSLKVGTILKEKVAKAIGSSYVVQMSRQAGSW